MNILLAVNISTLNNRLHTFEKYLQDHSLQDCNYVKKHSYSCYPHDFHIFQSALEMSFC